MSCDKLLAYSFKAMCRILETKRDAVSVEEAKSSYFKRAV
jgi:hypothetical protein